MFELAGAVIIGFLSLQGVKFLLTRGIVLRARRARREPNAMRPPLHQRRSRREQENRWGKAEEREAERQRQNQRERAAKQSEESEWWSVLGVSRDASPDEIRQTYLRKIKQSHPDRVAWLGPEFVAWGEKRSKTLNAAYAEAIRARGDK